MLVIALKKNSRLVTNFSRFYFYFPDFFQVWKIAGQISRLFQEFKTLYEPCTINKPTRDFTGWNKSFLTVHVLIAEIIIHFTTGSRCQPLGQYKRPKKSEQAVFPQLFSIRFSHYLGAWNKLYHWFSRTNMIISIVQRAGLSLTAMKALIWIKGLGSGLCITTYKYLIQPKNIIITHGLKSHPQIIGISVSILSLHQVQLQESV